MKIYSTICASVALSLGLSMSVIAKNETDDIYISNNELQRISVKWIAPKSYNDVRDSNASRTKFRRHVFSELEKHLDKLAQDLPDGQVLNLSVTNLDLAGRVEPASFAGLSSSMQEIRVMRDIDIPRIDFTYELVDASGSVIKSEEVELKDMSYLSGIAMSGRDRPFEYEKRMLGDWFARNIIGQGIEQ